MLRGEGRVWVPWGRGGMGVPASHTRMTCLPTVPQRGSQVLPCKHAHHQRGYNHRDATPPRHLVGAVVRLHGYYTLSLAVLPLPYQTPAVLIFIDLTYRHHANRLNWVFPSLIMPPHERLTAPTAHEPPPGFSIFTHHSVRLRTPYGLVRTAEKC